MTDGEVAACLLNLVYPRAFSRESLHGIDVSCELRNNKDLFLEAAFAQQFIAKSMEWTCWMCVRQLGGQRSGVMRAKDQSCCKCSHTAIADIQLLIPEQGSSS
ncbi:hypothetical protein Tcan_05372 [Toxocara canis]|uniref:Uncharacterized protein n=1 Tax=Toxocara canis TaxID=6265 RepID=A0A0B2VYB2_TOXCA|nr:hypothetical protein Tcan_05372 [Toxocara canis]